MEVNLQMLRWEQQWFSPMAIILPQASDRAQPILDPFLMLENNI